jgi:hypothetical protein
MSQKVREYCFKFILSNLYIKDMKTYTRTWKSRMEGDISSQWSSLPNPMSLTIKEEKRSAVFIVASLGFLGIPIDQKTKYYKGSLFYKIEVNGKPIVQYHISNPRNSKKAIGVNLHAKTEVPAGENNVEVFYKMSKNGSWDLLRYQSQRQLSVLTQPTE